MKLTNTITFINATASHQTAAMQDIHSALAETHGIAFADAFLRDYHFAIVKAVRTRLCGRSEAALIDHTGLLDNAD